MITLNAQWNTQWNRVYDPQTDRYYTPPTPPPFIPPTYQAFVPPPLPVLPAWAQVLGVSATATRADIDTAYRKLVKTAHPDAGGSHDQMIRLNKAVADARKAIGH